MPSTVLVVTSLEDVTADWVIEALNEREVPVVRVDPADIGAGFSFAARIDADAPVWSGWLRTGSREVEWEEVAAVYYRRPTPYAVRFGHLPSQQRDFATAEARHGLGGVLNHLPGVLYVNDPAAVARADFKPSQLMRFVELGLTIPPTLVTNAVEDARKFAAEHDSVIYKSFRGLPPGEDGHTGAIWAQRVDPGAFDDSLTVTAHLFQAEVPKAIAVALHDYLASFGLVFGCFDFALTGDSRMPESWTALECNPNGQWGWLPDADAITEAFADILSRKESDHGHARRP
ncbi:MULTISPECIES: MvdC/MvdD family ATP grasp protein [unclassified Streptomyces]|uniref:MvdD-like pre-ATP grasp domain-containing protein n=1 Tax=Streptomyces sp. NBC_00060 TaxID=2975636 RepID=A0AAU2GYY5_9ACTN